MVGPGALTPRPEAPFISGTMERIESIDDPRIAAYRNLKDRTLRGERLFVTEGRLLTLRLLESRYQARSVLVAERFAEDLARAVPHGVPLYVAPEKLLWDVVGFKFHRGVLACGRRGEPMTVDELMAERGGAADLTLIVCPAVTDRQNLGSIVRIAGAFGLDGVILGKECCDPLSRRVLRVSMGAVFLVPIVQSSDLSADLRTLKDRWNVELWATVLDAAAEPLEQVRRPGRLALLFGNEAHGLAGPWLAACDRRVTIPMRLGTDSLNLAVAAGIFLYVLKPDAARSRP